MVWWAVVLRAELQPFLVQQLAHVLWRDDLGTRRQQGESVSGGADVAAGAALAAWIP